MELKFDALRAAYMGKQAPTDQRCEQDIWIPWIAKQNPGEEGFWSTGPVRDDHPAQPLRRHRSGDAGARGGRLNADVDTSHSDVNYGPTGVSSVSTSDELALGAKAEQAHWRLTGPTSS